MQVQPSRLALTTRGSLKPETWEGTTVECGTCGLTTWVLLLPAAFFWAGTASAGAGEGEGEAEGLQAQAAASVVLQVVAACQGARGT